jgi:hypothetical protein
MLRARYQNTKPKLAGGMNGFVDPSKDPSSGKG